MTASAKTSTDKNHNDERCNHPSLNREFVSGTPTENYVCAKCGLPLPELLRETRLK